MSGRKQVGFLMLLTALFAHRTAWAGLGTISTLEAKCEQATAAALAKLTLARAQCAVSCDKAVKKGKISPSECLPPYGTTMQACLGKVHGKASAAMNKKCSVACPTCYGGGDCATFENNLLGGVETLLDTETPLVFCDDSGSPDGLTGAETACRDAAAISATKFVVALTKCYAKCNQLIQTVKLVDGFCDPPTPLDANTAACQAKAMQNYAAAIFSKCTDAPECLANPLSPVSVAPVFDSQTMTTLPRIIQPTAANLTQDYAPIVFCH